MDSNYTVLARKYRSQDFNSLIGQDVLVKTLTTAINTDRIAHAYIFTGIRGTGKTSTARILAKSLNCLSSASATATPCGVCENCVAITNGQHIDVMEIDAASHTGVDNMRDIMDAAQYRPTNGRFKVYIIDEVHMLSTSAFNALLKTLEEPPSHVIFILATTEIRKVPVTILSRCQRFDLVRVSIEVLKKHFAWIADQEKVELSEAANELLARAADGSVRDGLSLLDQAIAASGGKVDEGIVLNMLKRADRVVVLDLMKTLLSGDTSAALAKSDEMYSNGADLSLLLGDMMEWVHWATRMHPAIKAGGAERAPYTADQRNMIQEIISNVGLNALSRMWQVMVASVTEMQSTSNQKQAFDMLVIRLMHVADIPPVSVLLDQAKTACAPTAVAAVPVGQPPAPEPAVQSVSTVSTIAELTSALREDKEMVLLSALTNNVEIVDFTAGKIRLFDRRSDRAFISALRMWLDKKTGMVWGIDVLEESIQSATLSEQKQAEIAADPLVANAMSLFDGAKVLNLEENK